MKRQSHDLLGKVARGFLFSLVAGLLFSTVGAWGGPGTETEEQALDRLISGYFSSWSRSDMDAYRACFHPQASVYFIDRSGHPHQYALAEFVAGQEKVHLLGPRPLSERPTKTSLAVRGRLAQAEVRWQLHKGSATKTGTDYFIFVKTDTGWRILSLVYEQDNK